MGQADLTATRVLFDMPDEIARLPRDKRGYPVPAFAAIVDGQPDFRVVKPGFWINCIKRNRCWICGNPMGSRKWFVIGPMCCVNRVSSEPPSHRGCAIFAAKNCPFLTRPMAKRNERGLPADKIDPPGFHIARNPGATAVWETETYKVFDAGNGYLVEIGRPKDVTFWREGRKATRAEVLESVKTGLPYLAEMAEQDGPEGMQALVACVEKFRREILERFTAPPPDLAGVELLKGKFSLHETR